MVVICCLVFCCSLFVVCWFLLCCVVFVVFVLCLCCVRVVLALSVFRVWFAFMLFWLLCVACCLSSDVCCLMFGVRCSLCVVCSVGLWYLLI